MQLNVGKEQGAAVVAASSSGALLAISAQAPAQDKEDIRCARCAHLIRATRRNAGIAEPKQLRMLLNPEILDVPPPTPAVKLILRLVDEAGLTEKQVHDFRGLGWISTQRKTVNFYGWWKRPYGENG